MAIKPKITSYSPVYFRLIALWVVCEAMLGGVIHGLKIPVSGLVVGSCAVVCICLIAWYVPARGAILKATLIVAIFKMMLSPQAPPPAYVAVFFQGMLGELLFRKRKFYAVSCVLLSILALLESGLQRILVLTIVYGNDLWIVFNDFINGLTKQKQGTNYSLLVGSAYVLLHLITGIVVGWWVAGLPKRVANWEKDPIYIIKDEAASIIPTAKLKKRKLWRKGLFIVWIALVLLYLQSYFKIGTPVLPSSVALKLIIRSVIIVFSWIFLVGPLLTQLLHGWLKKKQSRSQGEIREVLQLLPSTRALVATGWKLSGIKKGWSRFKLFSRYVLVNALSEPAIVPVYILTAPIQSGKTTSLAEWSAKRKDVWGILTPIVNGKRIFKNISTGEQFPMESMPGETEILSVGRFVFSKPNFEKAIQIIHEAIHKDGWLVIDEIGPLELRGEGFAEIVRQVIANRRFPIVLVAREGLAENIKEYFNLPDAVVIYDINNLN